MSLEQMLAGPHYVFTKMLMGAGGLALGIVALLDTVTAWGQAFISAAAVIGAAGLTYAAVMAKLRWEQGKERRQESREEASDDAQALIEREKLADQRISSLITEMNSFHSAQVKGLEASVLLAKELYEQEKQIAVQQRELITQQATAIQQLKELNAAQR